MVTIKVFDPCGAVGATMPHAPRLPDLSGRTICEISNGSWQDQRTFRAVRGLLKERFPSLTIVPYTEFPVGVDQIDTDEIGGIVRDRGCQAAIVGNGG